MDFDLATALRCAAVGCFVFAILVLFLVHWTLNPHRGG